MFGKCLYALLGLSLAWGGVARADEFGEDGTYQPLVSDGPAIIYGGNPSLDLPNVAIVAAAGTAGACQFTDPQTQLAATGRFGAVDIINVQLVTPTLADLQQYDAIICWTNTTPLDTNAWGDAVADYIDAGGGVVSAVFATSTTTTNRHIGGRYDSEQYWVIQPKSGSTSGATSLGTISVPGHPTIANVASLSGTTVFRPTGTTLHPDGQLVASWADGKILCAVRDINGTHRADLGLYPPGPACNAGYPQPDNVTLLANALEWVAGPGLPPCTGNEQISKVKFNCVNKLKVVTKGANPGDTVDVTTQGQTINGTANAKGYAKFKFKKLPNSSGTVDAAWGCGATASEPYGCA